MNAPRNSMGAMRKKPTKPTKNAVFGEIEDVDAECDGFEPTHDGGSDADAPESGVVAVEDDAEAAYWVFQRESTSPGDAAPSSLAVRAVTG